MPPGKTENTLPVPERFGRAESVCALLGGIARSTLYVWLNDPAKNFPRPCKLGAGTIAWWLPDVMA
jgi:predicted DNA-binding transcriptional regulator AlpA